MSQTNIDIDSNRVPINSEPRGTRKWSAYLKEFLMLILAILLVFFVENQRKAYVERQSAKVLATSTLKDLERDQKALGETIHFIKDKDQITAQFINPITVVRTMS